MRWNSRPYISVWITITTSTASQIRIERVPQRDRFGNQNDASNPTRSLSATATIGYRSPCRDVDVRTMSTYAMTQQMHRPSPRG